MSRFRNFYNRKASSFSPHKFESKVEILEGLPKIFVSKVAFSKMWHYVDIASEEVSWLGTVGKIGNDFLIKDVYLLEQEVSSAQTIITEDGLADFGNKILQLQDGIDIYNNIRFWGHSHVNMSTSPSGQDENQMDLFESSDNNFFIRGILNKNGRMEFTLYFYDTGLKIVDLEWSVYDPIDHSLRDIIQEEFDEKVKKQVYVGYNPTGGYFNNSKQPSGFKHKGIKKRSGVIINEPFKTNRSI